MQGNDDEFKKITEDLYKKNLDLFNANRQFSLLQELYQIIVSTLTFGDIANKFINTIIGDLDFYAGAVFFKIRDKEILSLYGVSTQKPNVLTESLGKSAQKDIPITEINNIVIKAFKEQKVQTGNSLKDVLLPFISSVDVDILSNATSVKSMVVFPISFGTQPLGAFVVFLRQVVTDLSEFEYAILGRCATVFGVAIDRLMIYQSLQDANQKLIDLDKQKDEFLSMAAHELRAPMTAIKGYISMIVEGDTGEIPEKARGYLADAGSVTDRLIRLVNNMLNVSRIEEGRLVYQVEQVNLSTVAQSVFNQFRPEAERKQLEYKLEIPQALRDKVEVDPDRVQEVVGNLVSNAIKYTEKGFVKIILSQASDQAVRFEVADSGPGISAEEQSKLFGKFYRAESSVGKTTGTGLGLYISKLLVEKFSGKIGLTSEVGKGSIFWVELPLVVAGQKPQTSA
jgi:signal transduction histidine kinase